MSFVADHYSLGRLTSIWDIVADRLKTAITPAQVHRGLQVIWRDFGLDDAYFLASVQVIALHDEVIAGSLASSLSLPFHTLGFGCFLRLSLTSLGFPCLLFNL